MTLTTDDLTAIDVRTKSAIEKALTKNNVTLRQEMKGMLAENNVTLRQEMAEMLAENNQVIIDGLAEYMKKTADTDAIKKQLRNHQHRIEKIETVLQS
jgi:ubiquinone biosynthesis protein UbiJ